MPGCGRATLPSPSCHRSRSPRTVTNSGIRHCSSAVGRSLEERQHPLDDRLAWRAVLVGTHLGLAYLDIAGHIVLPRGFRLPADTASGLLGKLTEILRAHRLFATRRADRSLPRGCPMHALAPC